MAIIIILIFLILFAVIPFSFAIFSNKEKESVKKCECLEKELEEKHQKERIDKEKELEEKRTKEETPAICVESIDQLFAQANGKWVCRYCETINAYPDGGTHCTSAVSFNATGLRGRLIEDRRNVQKTAYPTCIVCGKAQFKN